MLPRWGAGEEGLSKVSVGGVDWEGEEEEEVGLQRGREVEAGGVVLGLGLVEEERVLGGAREGVGLRGGNRGGRYGEKGREQACRVVVVWENVLIIDTPTGWSLTFICEWVK